eukprot:403375087
MIGTMHGELKNDEKQNKKLNFSHEYYLFHHTQVYFVFIAKSGMKIDTLENFYLDLKKDILSVCRNNLNVLQDQELNDGFYQRQLQPKLEQRLKTYQSTVGKSEKVQIAQQKVDIVKVEMKKNVVEMSNNVGNVRDRLLVDAQELNLQARKFQKDAKALEQEASKRNFWTFSPKCMLMAGGTGGAGVAVYFIIRALILR